MRRPVLIAALVALLALLGSACAPGDTAALVVNDDEVLSVAELSDQLDQIAGSGGDGPEDEEAARQDFLTTFDARGQGQGTLSAGFVASVLSNHVLNALVATDLEEAGVEVTEADVEAGTELLAQQLGGEVDLVPSLYRETLIELFAGFIALSGSLDGGEVAAQERATELLAEAEVEVARRYGRWDAESSSVVPPEGPVTPTTAPLAVPGG